MRLAIAIRTTIAFLALGMSALASGAQPVFTGEPLILGQRFTLRSAVLGEQRSYQVHRPVDYAISSARYPVLYVTDGIEHFQQVSTTVDFLAAAGEIPPMIVVGIPNTDRFRDLVGYTKEPGPSRFLQFITGELAPKIDADYRTLPWRALTGWSDGGLFALHALMHAPGAFRGYIVLAAAFGDDQAMPGTLQKFFESHPDPTLNVDMYFGMDDVRGRALGWTYDAAAALQGRAGRVRDLRFTFRYYEDESHMSVPMRGMQDGLRSIFAGWNLADPFALYEQGGLPAIEKHFAALAERLGFAVPVPESALSSAFNRLEGAKRYTEAEQVIARAVALHPQSTTALYYQARVQGRAGNNAQALETLRKLLRMAPGDGGALSLLRQMQVDPATVAPPPAAPVPPQDLARFTGQYGNPAQLVVELRGERLYGSTAELELEFIPLSDTRFRVNGNSVYADGRTVEFRTDARGRVTGLVFGNGGAELVRSN